MSNNGLCHPSAAEALKSFKARKLNPRQLMATLIDCAETIDPFIFKTAFAYEDAVGGWYAENIWPGREISDGL